MRACVHVGHYGCKYIRSDCGFSTQLSPVLFGNFYNAKKAPDEAGESCGQPDQCRFALPAHSQTLTAFVNDAAQNMEPIDVGGVAEAVGTCKKTHNL